VVPIFWHLPHERCREALDVLITGVNGFVGGHLFKYLHEIESLSIWGTIKSESKLLGERIRKMDILRKEDIFSVLSEAKPRYIIHLAAQSSVSESWLNPQQTFLVNVNGTLNLLDCIKDMKIQCKILLIGSCEEYGLIEHENQPISENHILNPINPYAISKAMQNKMAQLYQKSYGLDIVIVRPFNQIGPGQDARFVLSYFAKRIAEIEHSVTDSILKVGNLDAVRDFIDIRDAVSLYWLSCKRGVSGDIYNIGSGKGYKILELLNMLLSLSTADVKVIIDHERVRPLEVPVSISDTKKVKEFFEWIPSYTIESSLEDILNYWRKKIREEETGIK
jgi:GDP-4-dehydro-6-deoxy-D-mannose reductase